MKWISVKTLKKGRLPNGKVLVTNNPTAKDNCGNMTHVWLATLKKEGSEYVGVQLTETFNTVKRIEGVTHYMVPIFDI